MAQRITRTPVSAEKDETPAEAPRRIQRGNSSSVGSGWGAPKQKRRETVRAPYLDLRNGKLIIKLLEAAPAVNYRRHYIKGRKPSPYVTCPQVRDDDYNIIVPCAICETGLNYPSQTYIMNVVDMDDRETVKTWTFGREVASILQEHAEEPRNNPLDRTDLYFQVWTTKDSGRASNRVVTLNAGYLADYALTPLDEDEIETLSETLYGEDSVWIDSEKVVKEVAQALLAAQDNE